MISLYFNELLKKSRLDKEAKNIFSNKPILNPIKKYRYFKNCERLLHEYSDLNKRKYPGSYLL